MNYWLWQFLVSLSLLWLSLLDERRKFLDFIRLPTMALYWSLGILFTSSTLLSQLFFVLQTNMILLQFVFMFVPSFLCLCKQIWCCYSLFSCLSRVFFVFAKKICWFAICFYVCPRLPLFCKKKYVVSAISSYVCPKIPLFLQKICCFCNFLLCLSQVFEKTYYVDVICFISILHWQIF